MNTQSNTTIQEIKSFVDQKLGAFNSLSITLANGKQVVINRCDDF